MTLVETEDDGIVLHAGVQDVLIIISAGLSFLKSIISVDAYSYTHFLVALLELAASALAFTLFVLSDYMKDDGSTVYGDDIMLFLLSFSSACVTEVIDVVFTFQTVYIYKKMKTYVDENKLSHEDFQDIEKSANCVYIVGILFGIATVSICPLVAFSRAGWVVAYFAPSDFSPMIGKYLLVSMILTVILQGSMALIVILNMCNEQGMLQSLKKYTSYTNFLTIPGSVLIYIVLARVEEGKEAGSLTYLLMINAFQSVEMLGETSRLTKWILAEMEIAPISELASA